LSINLQTRLDERLWNSIESTYNARNFSGAVIDTIHFIGQMIRDKSGLESDGVPLVGAAFGGKTPILKVSSLQTETDLNIQQGIEQLLRGMYQALRNPRSHGKVTDTQEDADAIILFLNYIVKQVDQSKSPFDRATFTKGIFDPLFPKNERYAELLAEELPPRLRLETLIQTFRDRETGDPSKLALFTFAVIQLLANDEIDQFCAVVSEELRSIEDESAIRTAIQLVPRNLWVRYSEIARLRIEERLIASITLGRYQSANKKLVSGAFGTWAMGLVQFFTLKSTLAFTIVGKLTSTDALEQGYGIQYFGDCLAALEPEPDLFLICDLEQRLRSGDEVLYRHLQWIKRPSTPVGWKTALEKAYDEFVKADPFGQGITDDDVPF
jgi:uncharacterized protein (TIGR02391 family)